MTFKTVSMCCLVAASSVAAGAASAQTPLSAYADAKGYIHVQKLTCAQLAGTYQEDADFLGVWYSGWYNGLGKHNTIKVERVKDGIHEVIVHCKANPGKTIIRAIDFVLKSKASK